MSFCEVEGSIDWRANEQDNTLIREEIENGKPVSLTHLPLSVTASDRASNFCGKIKKSSSLQVRSICCGDFFFNDDERITSVQVLKETICQKNLLTPDVLLIVQNGVELKNDVELRTEDRTYSSPIYVLVRTSINFKIPINFKEQGSKSKSTLEFDINSRIFYVKKQLYSKGVTLLKPTMQRLISGSHVLKDDDRIGDYLLSKQRTSSSKSSDEKESGCIVHIWKSFDQKQDVKIELSFPPQTQVSKFSMGICDSISHVRDILSRQFGIHVGPAFSISLGQEVLHPTRSLLDYSVTAKTGLVKLLALPVLEAEHAFLLASHPNPSELFVDTVHASFSSFTAHPKKKSLKLSSCPSTGVGEERGQARRPQRMAKTNPGTTSHSLAPSQLEPACKDRQDTKSNLSFPTLKKGFFNKKRDRISLKSRSVEDQVPACDKESSAQSESQQQPSKKNGVSSASSFNGMKKGFLL